MTRSLAFAEKHFDCRMALCPDAALMLGRQERATPRARVFALLRTDHERAPGSDGALPDDVIADDWLDEDEREQKRIRLSLRLKAHLYPLCPGDAAREATEVGGMAARTRSDGAFAR